MRKPRLMTVAFSMAILVLLTALSGCSAPAPKTVSLPDSTGAFHILVPATWQHQLASGYIGLYAADSLPSDPNVNAVNSAPSMIILTTTTESSTPVPVELKALVDMRAAGRGWKSKTVQTPRAVTVGGRPGYCSDVSGVDASGTKFRGRFYVVRSAHREVFVAALASPSAWSAFSDQVDGVMKNWYWQLTDAADQTQGTAPTQSSGHPTGSAATSKSKK